ncbi:hypothetical protein BDA96_05G218500 [Sorghum bicolor]|jgi:hypothetical protein|uniref:CASP-like protein 1U3 n=2 Tax=Sorghum bicolor TaxID=4558 RepID=CSPLE_SORBI|nr:cASP-like protein 1U3 [Sorghum bicolor]C5Y7C7.1 RecName: Full=CASP-like protein 1U3; Short=SbCASPL1U3 [Sorghum bicolor]EES10193.1 hypothetical protein SORBI_3005G202300 [Sorghum bicolor]KAG0530805.1 hypothetical protein BDA96_05G218500 [Sorghum bicolor]|eukprot:XP_002451205.1 CASP-like protein 1U3 [Sorghum bicolor]
MHDEEKKEPKWVTAVSIAGRIAGMGLAVAAAVLMSTASQCTVYYAAPAASAYGGAARARTVTYSDFPPFVFLVGAASIAAFLEAIAIFLVVWKKGKDKTTKVLMPLLGVAVPALLYSATGAAFAAVSDMSYCSANGKRVSICAGSAAAGGGVSGGTNFCSQVHIAVYLSLAAAVAVSVAEVVRGLGGSASGGGSDSDSSSSSESGGCDHGCHHKH